MNLVYDAIDATGRQVNDVIEADSSRAAVESLRRKGLLVTHIVQADARQAVRAQTARDTAASVRFPLKVLTLFTRQMAMLLRSGSAVVPALSAIGRQMKRAEHASLLARIRLDLEEGTTLTDALRKYPQAFDPTYCALVAAGEASANLAEMFDRLARVIGKRKAMRGKITGSLAYPVLLIGLCSVIVTVLMFFVIPRFGEMFRTLGAELPASTSFMLSLSEHLRDYWPVCAALVCGVIIAAVLLVKTIGGRQWCADVQTRLPVIGRLRSRLIQAEAFRILGLLIESRVGLLDALDLARRVTGNRRFQSMFDAMEAAVSGGGAMSAAMEASTLVAPSICQAVRTGEDSGKLGESISYVADILDEENGELVNAAMKLMEPLILMGMGVVVGIVAVSLFMPLFDLTSAVR